MSRNGIGRVASAAGHSVADEFSRATNTRQTSKTQESADFQLVVTPAGRPGRFTARLGGRLVVASSRQPLLDGARVLLAEGADPRSRITMRHAGADHVALA